MKKIIMVLAAVAMAASVQASAFKWSTSMSGKVYEAGTTTLLGSATAYLFETSSVSQSDLLTAFVAGSLDLTSGKLSNASVSAGKISATSFDWGSEGDEGNFYFALISDDNLFIGPEVYGAAQATGKTTSLSFAAASASQLAAKDASAGYAGAGWYTAAVPEPTSGLLMLLGMAGLALRRRRA